ncbi:FxsA family protein [Chitinivorax sp. B]|uniref:FxsA family protein n=1 Tax=Chitinivorax sp. B TaxID=2502235 RepID=UPI0010F4EE02|nr:FxsA family protein [Chitinivorax sp. B]
MVRIVLFILLGFPVLELATTLWVGSMIGGWIWLWLLGSFLGGMLILKGQRLGAPLLIMQALKSGNPVAGMLWNVRIALCGIMLIVPGVLSDALALLLLLPWQPKFATVKMPQDDTIEGEYRRVDDSFTRLR